MNIRPFQIVLIGVFATLALFSLIFFSFYKGSSEDRINPYGDSVVIWGTLDRAAFETVFFTLVREDKNFGVVQYVQKDARTFDTELPNAIAEGRSPDLILLSHDLLVKHRDKLQPVSYQTIPERTFRDTYIDGAEIFMQSGGIYGIPFGVDPLVMYWNRDMFASNGLASPPRTWESLVAEIAPRLTRVSPSLSLTQSAVAFGEYGNIRHAKAILSMLFLQAGTSIVTESEGKYRITLRQETQNSLPPADAALSFYTQFSQPTSPNYSWNRSLREDNTQFIAEQLGIYFGFGSEYQTIQNQNPNLNFDIAAVPQGANATTLRTYGTFYAFAIPRASTNLQGAYAAATVMSNATYGPQLAEALRIAPVRRAVLSEGSTSPYRSVIYQMALISRGWLDPDPAGSANVFRQMVEDVTSGRARVSQVVSDTVRRLELLF